MTNHPNRSKNSTATYFLFNEVLGTVAKLNRIPEHLTLNRYVNIGPSHNNQPAPRAFITDNFETFLREGGYPADGWVAKHIPTAPFGAYDGVDPETGELSRR